MALLTLNLYCCSALGNSRANASKSLIDTLSRLGGVLLTIKNGRPLLDPYEHIDNQGNIVSLPGLEHSLLAPDQFSKSSSSGGGSASLAFVAKQRYCCLGQSAAEHGKRSSNRLAGSQLDMGLLLYSELFPAYSYICEPGENEPAIRTCRNVELTHVFWANLFGPTLVRKLGADFLLDAPAYRVETLPDGGVLCVATENYEEWVSGAGSDLSRYLEQKAPSIRRYRSRGFDSTEARMASGRSRRRREGR